MSIHFTCINASCAKSVRAPEAAAGKKARCPYCGTVQDVPAPAPEEMFEQADAGGGSLLGQMEFKSAAATASAPPRPFERSKRPYVIAAIAVVGTAVLVTAVLVMMNTKKKPAAGPVAGAVETADAQPIPPIPGEESPVAKTPASPTRAPGAVATPLPQNTPAGRTPPAKVAAAVPSPQPATAATQTAEASPTPAPTGGQTDNGMKILPSAVPVVIQPGLDLPANYITVLMSAKSIAQMRRSQSDMDSIKKAVMIYAAQHDDKWPNSFDDLIKDNLVGDDKMLMNVARPTVRKIYVSGQGANSPGKNILVYDPVAYDHTKIAVLKVDGTITWMTPEELKTQMTAQKAKPEEMPLKQ